MIETPFCKESDSTFWSLYLRFPSTKRTWSDRSTEVLTIQTPEYATNVAANTAHEKEFTAVLSQVAKSVLYDPTTTHYPPPSGYEKMGEDCRINFGRALHLKTSKKHYPQTLSNVALFLVVDIYCRRRWKNEKENIKITKLLPRDYLLSHCFLRRSSLHQYRFLIARRRS